MVAAWLPGAVRWQPYGRLRVRAVPFAPEVPGFASWTSVPARWFL